MASPGRSNSSVLVPLTLTLVLGGLPPTLSQALGQTGALVFYTWRVLEGPVS